MSVTIPSARDTEWIPNHLPAEEAVNAIEGGSNCLCLDKIGRGFIRWLLIDLRTMGADGEGNLVLGCS